MRPIWCFRHVGALLWVPGLMNRVLPLQKTQAHFIWTYLLLLNLWWPAWGHPFSLPGDLPHAGVAILSVPLLVSSVPGFCVCWALSLAPEGLPLSVHHVPSRPPSPAPCSLVCNPSLFRLRLQLRLPVIQNWSGPVRSFYTTFSIKEIVNFSKFENCGYNLFKQAEVYIIQSFTITIFII